MAKDIYHNAVKEALIKDNWIVTHDPFFILSKEEGGLITDLGAEKVIIAEKGLVKIAVEVKSFVAPSLIHEFIRSAGQYRAYVLALREKDPDRKLYLAMPDFTLNTLIKKDIVRSLIDDLKVRIILFDPVSKTIKAWKE